MDTYNSKYYEPLEQMMAIRHQYMSKILRDHSGQDIYEFFKNKKILDLGCGTGEFLNNYYGMGAECSGIDIENNFKIKNKKNKVNAGATELFDKPFLQKWTPHKRSRPIDRGVLHRIAAHVSLA